MKPYKNYNRDEAYKERRRLPVGGYVLKILNAEETAPYSDGCTRLLISFDIAEGEEQNYYAEQYHAQSGEDKKWKGVYRLTVPNDDGSDQDGYRRKRFTSFIVAVEDSNAGYHWDWAERGLKGKLFGGIFNNKQYEFNGKQGFFTNLARVTTVDKIRTGDYDVPADTLLEKPSAAAPPTGQFYNPADFSEDEGLPFA